MQADLVLTNVGQLAGVTRPGLRSSRAFSSSDFHVEPGLSLAAFRGEIVWIGRPESMPTFGPECVAHDVRGRVVIPGLVDSHTHLIYVGERVEEFAWRLAGASYLDIAKRGGGINTTVRTVREATSRELARQTRLRLQRALASGVTTLEIKTGYGLDTATELRCLEVIDQLHREGPGEIVATFLQADEHVWCLPSSPTIAPAIYGC